MKTIILLLFAFTISAQTQGNYPIPAMFAGTWTNEANNDTLTITEESITWTSTENEVVISYVDYIVHSDSVLFGFYAYPNVYVLSLEKVSRLKIIFDAQTIEGYSRRNELYLKTTRSKQ